MFETRRLALRPRTLSDTEDCLDMDREPEVTRFVRGPWSDPIAHRAFIQARTIGPYADGLGYWTICRRDEPGSFFGWVLLIPADGTRPDIEIGWRLRPTVWRQGIASEAAAVLLRHALATLLLPEVIAEIDPDNVASRRVAEKLGMRPRAIVRNDDQRLVRYSMTLGEFRLWSGSEHDRG